MSERDERAQAELDERLSQLIDGELDPESARALRERIAQTPALARRLAELESVDEALRALPAPPVPSDLRARLRDRIERAGSAEPASRPAPAPASVAAHAPRVPHRRRPVWIAAAAMAASVALYLVFGLRGGPPDPGEPVEATGSIASAGGGERTAGSIPVTRLEQLVETTPDEELAIALDYDALRDFEIIDQLELLEALAAMDDAGASG